MKHMDDAKSFLESLKDLQEEKGIDREVILETVKNAIAAAYKKNYGTEENVDIEITDDGEVNISTRKLVVKEVTDESLEISLADAKAINKKAKLGEEIVLEEKGEEFRRNAVQNAKQIIIQKIREEERNTLLKKFEELKGTIITGLVKHIDKYGNVYLDLGENESFLPPHEQIPTDVYKIGKRVKIYVTDVLNNSKFPKILLSRKNPGFLKELMRFEIPEIDDGIIKIMAIARDAGSRSKVAVFAQESHVDPLGACIGTSGTRIKAVLEEIMPEKIDIVEWNENPAIFVANALKPARVLDVDISDDNVASVLVAKDQFSLAIGRGGQNVKLSSRLVNMRINIKYEDNDEEIDRDEDKGELHAAEEADDFNLSETNNNDLESVEEVLEETAADEEDAEIETAEKTEE